MAGSSDPGPHDPKNVPIGNVKCAFRTDHAAGYVVAYFSTVDDKHRFELGRCSTNALRNVPGLWDGWRKLMSDAVNYTAAVSAGVDPADVVSRPQVPVEGPDSPIGNRGEPPASHLVPGAPPRQSPAPPPPEDHDAEGIDP